MKNGFRSISLCILLSIASLMFITSGVAQNTIDFSESTNLKAVYDAGLRPWRIRADEISTLLITNEHVRVIAPNGNVFTMSVQIGNFSVLAEHQLAKAGFNSPLMSLDEATAKVREICEALEIDTSQGAGMGSLEEKAEQFAVMGNQTPVPRFWNGRRERGADGARYSVSLQPGFGYAETGGRVLVTLDFHEPGQPMRLSTEPLTPPPGYEGMSMERPETDSREPFPDPAYSMDAVKERMEEAAKTKDRTPVPPPGSSSTPEEDALESAPVLPLIEPPQSIFLWRWIIGGTFFIALIGGVLFRFFRRKS